jgi:DNA-binding transcriptional LysR family regulator
MTGENGIREIVDNTVAQLDVRLAIASEVSNLATVFGLLEEGFGITALPGLALPPGNHPRLVYRPLSEPRVERTIRVIWRHGIGLAPPARALVATIRTVLSGSQIAEEGMRVELAEPA